MSKRQRDNNTMDNESIKTHTTNYAVFTHEIFECTNAIEGYTKGGSGFISFCRTKPKHNYKLIGICTTSANVRSLINQYLAVHKPNGKLAFEIYDDATKFDNTHDCVKKK